MIATVLMVSLRRLLHNRVELLLTFLVPIAFFSIFAIIFGGGVGTSSTPKIKVVAVDQVGSPQSKAMLDALHEIAGLRFVDTSTPSASTTEASPPQTISESKAKELVKRGTASMAIVLRKQDNAISADLLSDTSDQVAPQIVSALVQRAMLGVSSVTAPSRDGADKANSGASFGFTNGVAQAGGTNVINAAANVVVPTVRIVDVLGGNKSNPVVSMYAAGIAVMFLLFGATGGGGALLEERENQTLDRLLTTGLSMDELLLGKWFYLTVLGVIQTTVMFIWGQIAFGVELSSHLDGFLIMTLVTAGAAAAFGLLLATICKTRGQLNGLSVVVVLTMSALGGSMVPRYVMSQSLRDAGLWTFNAWALEGYEKVFWRDLPAIELWPQMSVLMLCGLTFLIAARVLAVRWETE
jgi:ABC-2 type transport system permease protein